MMPVDPKYDVVPDVMIRARDERYGLNTQRKKQQRQHQLTESFVPHHAADQYLHSGKTLQFRRPASWLRNSSPKRLLR